MGFDLVVEWSRRDLKDLVREALSYKCTIALVKFILMRGEMEGVTQVQIDGEVIQLNSLTARRRNDLKEQLRILLRDAATLRHHVKDGLYMQVFIDVVVEMAGDDLELIQEWYEEYCRELIMDTHARVICIRTSMTHGRTILSDEIEKVVKDLAQIIYYAEDWSGVRPPQSYLRKLIRKPLITDLCMIPGTLRDSLHYYNITCGDILLDVLEFD